MTGTEAQALRYVLSAGRTGTVFLAGLLNRQPGVIASHEPDSSRYQMMLANLRNDWGIGGGALKAIFERTRRRRLEAAAGRTYVEINPFLCPMTDLLPAPGRKLRIVHMVRDPATWAASMTSHKASPRFRPFIDYVPYGKFHPVPRPANWVNLSEYERALWRWNWCNSQVENLRAKADAYAVIRYEDLFSRDQKVASATLDVIRTTLGLPTPVQVSPDEMRVRANPSMQEGPDIDLATAKAICGSLARTYCYDY